MLAILVSELELLLVLTPLQAIIGDQHGVNTRKYQPAKIAAIEGLWESETGGTALTASKSSKKLTRIPVAAQPMKMHSLAGC